MAKPHITKDMEEKAKNINKCGSSIVFQYLFPKIEK